MMLEKEDMHDKLRKECFNRAFHTFGYQFIFDSKIHRLSRNINALKVMGLVVPAAVGITALGYGIGNPILSMVVAIAVPATIIQFLISVFAVAYKWDDELAYCYEASQSYGSLYLRYKKLQEFPPATIEDLSKEFDLLSTEYNLREQQDTKHNIEEWERRRGMKYSLRQHKKDCYGCKTTPLSMQSTDCDICGKFSFKYQYNILSLWDKN